MRAEREVVDMLRSLGIPAQRVVGSGAFSSAKSDVKVFVELNEDGTYPQADESKCAFRVEIKNRKDNPEFLFLDYENIKILLAETSKPANETVYGHYNQDQISKALIMRRAKVPKGSLEDPNQVYMVCMGLADYAVLLKRAYGDPK